MTFQFLCPQGHLLQGEEAHMGMECQCPQCGTAFIIPTIESAPGAASAPAADSAPAESPAQPPAGPPPLDMPQIDVSAGASSTGTAGDGFEGLGSSGLDDSDFDSSGLSASIDETLLHIPCPNGHELEVPMDMVGQRAMCPHCGVAFKLRHEKSIEYIFQQEALERRRGEFWFKMALAAAGVVGAVLLIMILAIALT